MRQFPTLSLSRYKRAMALSRSTLDIPPLNGEAVPMRNSLTERLDGLTEPDVIVVGNTTYNEVIQAAVKKKLHRVHAFRPRPSETRFTKHCSYCNPEGMSLASILEDYGQGRAFGGTQVYTYFLE